MGPGFVLAAVLLATPSTAWADMVINEVLPDPMGVDSGYEWIELLNNGAAAVDITGWLIERSTSGAFTVKFVFPALILQPGERLVVGEEFVALADYHLAAGAYFSFGNATLNGDAIHLCNNFGSIQDTLVYGPNNTDNFLDDTGGIALPAPGPLEDESTARVPDGVDTDDSGLDFAVDLSPTPGLDNASLPPMAITAASPGLAGQNNTWDLVNGPALATIVWFKGTTLGLAPVPRGACPGVELGFLNPKLLGVTVTDAFGATQLGVAVPAGAAGATVFVEALAPSTCEASVVTVTMFP